MKIWTKSTLALGIVLSSTVALASNYQSFYGLNFSNPAELTDIVNEVQIIIGDNLLIPYKEFAGTVTVPNGKGAMVIEAGTASTTDNTLNLPYGRIAKRFASQWVVGVDVTKPFYALVIWPTDSVARYASTELKSKATDIQPNIAYKFTGKLSKLSVGAGMDIAYYPYDLQRMAPSAATPTVPFGVGPDNFISEHVSGMATGWHAGLYYQLFKPTFVGLSYFSRLSFQENGISIYSGFPTSDSLWTKFSQPATTNLKIKQILTKKVSATLGLHYSQWDCFNTVVLHDVAGPAPTVIFTPRYHNTWREDLNFHYILSPKWDFDAAIALDHTPTNNVDRSLIAPDADTTALYAAAEYKLSKSTAIRLDYTYTFFNNVGINSHLPGGTVTVGNVDADSNLVGLRFTYST